MATVLAVEAGESAQLSILRWKYFVQSEDDAFVALMDSFTKATGVKITIARESYEDVQPKASVAANTGAVRTCSGVFIPCRTCFRRNVSTSVTSPTIWARSTAAGFRLRSPTAKAAQQVDRNSGLLRRQSAQLSC